MTEAHEFRPASVLFFAYNTFLPMHFTGLAGQPRHQAQLIGTPSAPPARCSPAR